MSAILNRTREGGKSGASARSERRQSHFSGIAHLPAFMFFVSAAIVIFFSGMTVALYGGLPYRLWKSAHVGAAAILQEFVWKPGTPYAGEFLEFSDTGIDELAEGRIRTIAESPEAPGSENFLFFGGLNQFLEFCPKYGCLAVRFAASGEMIQAYPYLPDEIYAANRTHDHPYSYLDFDPLEDTRPIGVELLAEGDLLVTFQISRQANVFPFGTGVARVGRDGVPKWLRFDYSHHWPAPIRNERLLIPALRILDEPVTFEFPSGTRRTLGCSTGKPYDDLVRELDGDGQVKREISVLDAVLRSPYYAIMQHTSDACDPLHLNFIDVVRDDLPAGIDNIEPGDLIVSLRNISAFGIMDGRDGRLKRLVRGSFVQQHSVQHLADSRFVMFDNHGAGGSSRILEIDLASGRERTIFPTSAHSDRQREAFSRAAGYVSISPDRTRLIATYSYQGTAFELRVDDGAVLREFSSLHDVSSKAELGDERLRKAAIFQFYGLSYVP